MVRFLVTVTGDGVKFEEGKTYKYTEVLDNEEYKDFILVKQPNSPKDKDWYCKIAKIHEGRMFEFID